MPSGSENCDKSLHCRSASTGYGKTPLQRCFERARIDPFQKRNQIIAAFRPRGMTSIRTGSHTEFFRSLIWLPRESRRRRRQQTDSPRGGARNHLPGHRNGRQGVGYPPPHLEILLGIVREHDSLHRVSGLCLPGRHPAKPGRG